MVVVVTFIVLFTMWVRLATKQNVSEPASWFSRVVLYQEDGWEGGGAWEPGMQRTVRSTKLSGSPDDPSGWLSL